MAYRIPYEQEPERPELPPGWEWSHNGMCAWRPDGELAPLNGFDRDQLADAAWIVWTRSSGLSKRTYQAMKSATWWVTQYVKNDGFKGMRFREIIALARDIARAAAADESKALAGEKGGA